ncbi:hypothetical protein [Dyella sp. GSA-30]|uniref:hypothetical protein n=1 Tax=Dyella sp. GSA-30 TaxID=2994496 RepID=UPI00248F72AE|nr:hypothetical protein [Dyella sp. GSA-30]BDU18615.1 hypothetical protein DYGSA30_00720 [Dyella sp. GSA-30]
MPATQPDWIPNWAWEEYLGHYMYMGPAFLQLEAFQPESPQHTDEEALETSTTIMMDPSCQSLWKAICKKVPKGYEAAQNGHCMSLLNIAMLAYKGPSTRALVPASERSKRGRKIAKLAAQLRDEILSLKDVGGEPMLITQALHSTLVKAMQSTNENHTTYFLLKDAREKLGEGLTSYGFLSVIATRVFGDTEDNVFTALEKNATAWSETKPTIYRASAAGANRQHFVQVMTYHFRSRYGKPWREHVATLVNCLYEEKIDAATVVKLAP